MRVPSGNGEPLFVGQGLTVECHQRALREHLLQLQAEIRSTLEDQERGLRAGREAIFAENRAQNDELAATRSAQLEQLRSERDALLAEVGEEDAIDELETRNGTLRDALLKLEEQSAETVKRQCGEHEVAIVKLRGKIKLRRDVMSRRSARESRPKLEERLERMRVKIADTEARARRLAERNHSEAVDFADGVIRRLQASFRGRAMRREYARRRQDYLLLRDAVRAVLRKLLLQLRVVRREISKGMLVDDALAVELTCRHCFSTFVEPVVLWTDRTVYCAPCALEEVADARRRRLEANGLEGLAENDGAGAGDEVDEPHELCAPDQALKRLMEAAHAKRERWTAALATLDGLDAWLGACTEADDAAANEILDRLLRVERERIVVRGLDDAGGERAVVLPLPQRPSLAAVREGAGKSAGGESATSKGAKGRRPLSAARRRPRTPSSRRKSLAPRPAWSGEERRPPSARRRRASTRTFME